MMNEQKPVSPLENLAKKELCPLLFEDMPCKYQEDICRNEKNNYHLCFNYRRYIREKLFEQFRRNKLLREKDSHGFYR